MKIKVTLYAANTRSYELITGKSLAMFLLRDNNNKIYLLRGTVASPYMAQQMYKDVKEAIELGFSLDEIADLYNRTKSLELLGTTMDIFQNYANDNWNWHKWSFNRNFQSRFWTYISEGRTIRIA